MPAARRQTSEGLYMSPRCSCMHVLGLTLAICVAEGHDVVGLDAEHQEDAALQRLSACAALACLPGWHARRAAGSPSVALTAARKHWQAIMHTGAWAMVKPRQEHRQHAPHVACRQGPLHLLYMVHCTTLRPITAGRNQAHSWLSTYALEAIQASTLTICAQPWSARGTRAGLPRCSPAAHLEDDDAQAQQRDGLAALAPAGRASQRQPA